MKKRKIGAASLEALLLVMDVWGYLMAMVQRRREVKQLL